MSEAPQSATKTIIPETISVQVGDQVYPIKDFCLAKTMRMFQLMTELATSAGVGDAIAAAKDAADEGEFEDVVAPGFVTRALAILPRALREGVPALYKVLGLIITPNSRLREMEENDEDVDAALLKAGHSLAYNGTSAEIVNLVIQSVPKLGVESILGNLPALMSLMRTTG